MQARSLQPHEWDAEPSVDELESTCEWSACTSRAEGSHEITHSSGRVVLIPQLCADHLAAMQDADRHITITVVLGGDRLLEVSGEHASSQ